MARDAVLAVLATLLIYGPLLGNTAPENCSIYNIDNLPHPRFILLGRTGVGKSTLGNQLLGLNPRNSKETVFSVGDGLDSHTPDITWQVGNWLGDGPCFTIIDTPGSSDSEGRDYQHALDIANIMKNQIKSVDIFLLCFNGEFSRFDQSVVDILKLYESIFSKEMWKYSITEITHWKHDARSVYSRNRNKGGLNEIKRHTDWNSQYKDELDVTIEIPTVYIDPVFPIFSDDPIDHQFIEERERKLFKKYTNELFEYGRNTPPFFCKGNCKAPDGYFLGNPWIKMSNITERRGEKAVLYCQIWNGIQGGASNNVTWAHNGEIIYQKTTNLHEVEPTINKTNIWATKVKFVENKSPGQGHYSDFIVQFDSLDETMEGNYTCDNGMNSGNNFAQVFMKVDGTWGEWGTWTKCSTSCLGEDNQMGSKGRVRIAVPPRNGGDPVKPLNGQEREVCAGESGPESPIPCPVDFSWNPWTEWSECSPRCGNGFTFRVRSCNQGSNGGALCPLIAEENLSEKVIKSCKIKDCPECIFLGWQEWSSCTKTCITENLPGTRTRKRTTKEADPNNPQCNPDDHYQVDSCNTISCPIDGVIGQWTYWSPTTQTCSKICNSTTQSPPKQIRSRLCIKPQHHGKPCQPFSKQNLPKQTRECPDFEQCPIDCQWNNWEAWSVCGKRCGKGIKRRTMTKKVSAEHGGKHCTDLNGRDTILPEVSETNECILRQCPPCKPRQWTSWGICPNGCKMYYQTRKRHWANPDNFHILGGTIENCYLKQPDTEMRQCDGKDGLAKIHRVSVATVAKYCRDCVCNDKECKNCECFAKGSKVTTLEGEKLIENLLLGDNVLTLKNRVPQFTPFLGWIHKETHSHTHFFTLNTKSRQITMTGKHVIFSKTHFSQKEPNMVFADKVKLGNYLNVLDDGQERWEEVLSIKESFGSGIYTPLTSEGTILVDNVLASCYADITLQSVVDFAFLPMKLFPTLLDDEDSQHVDGLRWYTKFIIQLGSMFNLVESIKNGDTVQPSVGQTLVLVALLYRKK